MTERVAPSGCAEPVQRAGVLKPSFLLRGAITKKPLIKRNFDRTAVFADAINRSGGMLRGPDQDSYAIFSLGNERRVEEGVRDIGRRCGQ